MSVDIFAVEVFTGFGLAGMFCSAFLAATILPLGSEAVMAGLLLNNSSPGPVILTATVGNVLGSLVNYALGRAGSRWLSGRLFRTSQAELTRALNRFKSWGVWGLLLAWMPVYRRSFDHCRRGAPGKYLAVSGSGHHGETGPVSGAGSGCDGGDIRG